MKEILIGTVGSLREKNIVQVQDDIIDELTYIKKEIDYSYIVKKLVPKMFKIKNESNSLIEKDKKTQLENPYLIAYDKDLYQIFSDGAVMKVDEYAAIGSGSNEALASFYNTKEIEPVERMKLAIQGAISNDIYIDYPIIIGNTKSEDFTVIEKA